ncbi:hypothetical protein JOM56_011937, partial [Amanita muscaria]
NIAELSRPRRQFKEDAKKKNKPSGQKAKHEKNDAKQVNWQNPLIWPHIEAARKKAGYPFRPADITREAKLMKPDLFHRLHERVVGQWIDTKARADGVFEWKDSVLKAVGKGHSPRGETTRVGILVCY